jgi:hemerythrin
VNEITESSDRFSSHSKENGMDIIKWRETYETGVQTMDSQHKRLIHLINQMYSILREKQALDTVDKVLAEMTEYAEQHFHDEEELLRRYDYPDISGQQASHLYYTQKIAALSDQKKTAELAAAQDIYAFLRSWWIEHITDEDKKYGPFLKDKGLV